MTRRIMLVEVHAQVPGARTYTTFNPADKDANLNLTNGNLTAKNANATSAWRAVRSTQSKTGGRWYAELKNDASVTQGMSVGIARGNATLNNYIGSGVRSWGLFSNDGSNPPRLVHDGSTSSATGITPLAAGNVSMVAVDVWLGKLWLGNNGVWPLGGDPAAGLNPSLTFTPGDEVYLAIALFEGTQQVTANFGATAFVHPVPQTFSRGWYTTAAPTANTLYLASERVLTRSTATPANQLYLARLLAGSDPTMKRRGSCWVWGGDSSKQGLGELEFANADRGLEGWGDLLFRDARVVVRYGNKEQVREPQTCEIWTEAIADRIEFTAHSVKLVLSDKLARLDKAGQQSLYVTGVQNAILVDQPKPTIIGRAANIEPVQTNTATYIYDCSDGGVAVEEITDRGDPFDLGAVDFERTPNGFDLVAMPAGKVAATCTACTSTVVVNTINEPFDNWSGGVFDTNPTGWTIVGEFSSETHVFESPTGVARFQKSLTYSSSLWIEKAAGFATDAIHRVRIDCSAYVKGHLRIYATDSGGNRSPELYRVQSTGLKEFFYRGAVGYSNLRIEAVYPVDTDVSITSVTVDQMQVSDRLADFIYECAVTRGGLSAGDLDTTTINALQAKAPYLLGFASTRQWKPREALRAALDSFCGGIYQDRLGKLAVWRLEEPAATPVLTLGPADVTDDWTRRMDTAPNLTTIIGALRNWTIHGDADFAGSVTQAMREILRSEFGIIRRALDVVDLAYIGADKGAPLPTLLTRDIDALMEITRVAWYYAKPRYLYAGGAFIDQTAVLTLKQGDTVQVQQNKYDLGAGKRLLVVANEPRFFSQRVNLELVG